MTGDPFAAHRSLLFMAACEMPGRRLAAVAPGWFCHGNRLRAAVMLVPKGSSPRRLIDMPGA